MHQEPDRALPEHIVRLIRAAECRDLAEVARILASLADEEAEWARRLLHQVERNSGGQRNGP